MLKPGTWVRVKAFTPPAVGVILRLDNRGADFWIVEMRVSNMFSTNSWEYPFYPHELEEIDEEEVSMYLIAGIGT